MTVRELIELLDDIEADDDEVLVEVDQYLFNRIEEVKRARWFGENPVKFIAITLDPAGRDFT